MGKSLFLVMETALVLGVVATALHSRPTPVHVG